MGLGKMQNVKCSREIGLVPGLVMVVSASILLVGCPASYTHFLEDDETPISSSGLQYYYKSELNDLIKWGRGTQVLVVIPKSDTPTFYKFAHKWYGGWDTIRINSRGEFDAFSLKQKDYKIEIVERGIFSSQRDYYHCANCSVRYGWSKFEK